ncbi:NUDIX hydrolase [Alkalicoccobacillus porphyridii]|uniref:NUDIX hydrolase n=1 Tax=Alkalicoccobacillus porphyridii TaxID=2597270 RepID=A0A553ZWE1_9BACI|nr:NUDIX hydrolase [Alkalicoccobacillus porphyridii]
MERIDVASVLVFDDNRNILLVNNKKGSTSYWSPPGGAVEAGETLEEAAVREAFEETGYHVEIGKFHSVRELFFYEANHHVMIFTFYAKIIGGSVQINDPDQDILDIHWMDHETARTCMSDIFNELQLDTEPSELTSFYQFVDRK